MGYIKLYILNEIESNGYNFQFLNIISILAIFTAIFVIITKNPIISVLFLIGLFIGIAVYLVLIGLSFLGLSYLLVYVGAVSILFLFILMLLNVRISELVTDTKNSIPLVFITAISFSLPVSFYSSNSESYINTDNIFIIFINIFMNNNIVYNVYSKKWDNNLAGSDHINSIGNIMYTSHNIWLILVSIILLLAMVGAIIITIKHKDNSKLLKLKTINEIE